jgi:hypothetical protein
MGTIVVSAQFECPVKERNFLQAVEALLRGLDADVAQFVGQNGVVMTSAQRLPPPELPPPATDAPAVQTAVEPETATTDLPVVPTSPPSEVEIKNLSSVCTIPFSFDTSLPCSELYVQKLASLGESVAFDYCSMSYKFPVEKAVGESVICNKDPQFTPTSIRALADFRNGANALSLLLKLTEGDNCHVVFGQDAADMVKQVMEKVGNDSLPT